jgi:hypothetical protein
MALFAKAGNYVKVRTTPLPETAGNEDYERIHITEFSLRSVGSSTVAFMDGDRTVLVLSGNVDAQGYYSDTMANLILALDAFLLTLEESGGSPGGSTVTVVSKSTGDFSGNNVTVAQTSGKTADTDFWIFSNGVLLEVTTDYTHSGTTITIPTGPSKLRILIFS